MSRIPPASFREIDRFLRRLGFERLPRRGKGSHTRYRHPDGRTATLPNHPGDIDPKLIRDLLSQINVSRDDYLAMR